MCEYKIAEAQWNSNFLIGEFPGVLSNELNPEPMKTEKPMHITLMPGATPKKVLSARRVPL